MLMRASSCGMVLATAVKAVVDLAGSIISIRWRYSALLLLEDADDRRAKRGASLRGRTVLTKRAATSAPEPDGKQTRRQFFSSCR